MVNEMKHTELDEQLQLQVIQYLYGDMDPKQRIQFEQQLESNAQLRNLLESEREFDATLPPGIRPHIDEERIQGNRWVLHQNLQRATRPRFSLVTWLQDQFRQPLAVAFQGAAMAATFVLGIMVASGPLVDEPEITAAVAAATPLSFINDDDYEIYQLEVNDYDAMTGDIDLSFSLASETRLRGNVADTQINRLMAVALQENIDSAARLDTINALQPVVSGDEIYRALINVLQNDQNPGVRYQAAASLSSLVSEDSVRDALRRALAEDVNQGVRVEAFNALLEYRDEQTLNVFRQRMVNDSNEYIRTQSRAIVEGLTEQQQQNDVI